MELGGWRRVPGGPSVVSTASVSRRYQGALDALCHEDARSHPRHPDRPTRQRRVRRPRPRAAGRRRAARPPGGVLLVHGPGGIGKSMLLREIRRRAEGRDAVRGRRARPGAAAGRRRAGAGRRVDRGAPAGLDRHVRAHERARRLPALDAPPLAARERGRHRRGPRRARARLVRGRLGDGRGRAAAGRALRARGARRCSCARACAPIGARRRSRAGPAGCRWRCGSARPPHATIRRGRRAPTRRRCAHICNGCRRPRWPVPTATCSRSRASPAWSPQR